MAQLLARANAEITQHTNSSIGEGDFLVIGDSMVVNPDGTHYLYSFNFKRNTFIRLDHSHFHGHNFVRYLFEYKGEVFAFGGYGFWNNHSKLIKFDKTSKEWELVLIKGLPLSEFQPILSHRSGDSLFVFGTFDHHNPNEVDKRTSRQFVINLHDLQCYEMEEQPNKILKNLSVKPYNHQFSNFIVWGTENTIDYVFDKQTRKYYRNASGPAFFAPFNIQKIQYKDSIFRFVMDDDYISVYTDGKIEKTNIREYIKLFGVEESDINTWQLKEESSFISWRFAFFLLLVLFLTLILGLIYYIRKRGNIFDQRFADYYNFLDSYDSIIPKINKFEQGEFSESEIDILLRISHLPKSMRMLKRSQMIFSINEHTPGLIEKIEHKDKREFRYLIKKLN